MSFKCKQCESTHYDCLDGRYFCSQCNVQIYDMYEVDDDEPINAGFSQKFSQRSNLNEIAPLFLDKGMPWTYQEAFAIILKKQSKSLLKCGVNKDLLTLSLELYHNFLQKRSSIFISPHGQSHYPIFSRRLRDIFKCVQISDKPQIKAILSKLSTVNNIKNTNDIKRDTASSLNKTENEVTKKEPNAKSNLNQVMDENIDLSSNDDGEIKNSVLKVELANNFEDPKSLKIETFSLENQFEALFNKHDTLVDETINLSFELSNSGYKEYGENVLIEQHDNIYIENDLKLSFKQTIDLKGVAPVIDDISPQDISSPAKKQRIATNISGLQLPKASTRKTPTQISKISRITRRNSSSKKQQEEDKSIDFNDILTPQIREQLDEKLENSDYSNLTNQSILNKYLTKNIPLRYRKTRASKTQPGIGDNKNTQDFEGENDNLDQDFDSEPIITETNNCGPFPLTKSRNFKHRGVLNAYDLSILSTLGFTCLSAILINFSETVFDQSLVEESYRHLILISDIISLISRRVVPYLGNSFSILPQEMKFVLFDTCVFNTRTLPLIRGLRRQCANLIQTLELDKNAQYFEYAFGRNNDCNVNQSSAAPNIEMKALMCRKVIFDKYIQPMVNILIHRLNLPKSLIPIIEKCCKQPYLDMLQHLFANCFEKNADTNNTTPQTDELLAASNVIYNPLFGILDPPYNMFRGSRYWINWEGHAWAILFVSFKLYHIYYYHSAAELDSNVDKNKRVLSNTNAFSQISTANENVNKQSFKFSLWWSMWLSLSQSNSSYKARYEKQLLKQYALHNPLEYDHGNSNDKIYRNYLAMMFYPQEYAKKSLTQRVDECIDAMQFWAYRPDTGSASVKQTLLKNNLAIFFEQYKPEFTTSSTKTPIDHRDQNQYDETLLQSSNCDDLDDPLAPFLSQHGFTPQFTNNANAINSNLNSDTLQNATLISFTHLSQYNNMMVATTYKRIYEPFGNDDMETLFNNALDLHKSLKSDVNQCLNIPSNRMYAPNKHTKYHKSFKAHFNKFVKSYKMYHSNAQNNESDEGTQENSIENSYILNKFLNIILELSGMNIEEILYEICTLEAFL